MKTKMSLIAMIIFIAFNFSIISQETNNPVNNETSVEQAAMQNNYALENDTSYFGGAGSDTQITGNQRNTSFVGVLIRTIFVLILIVVAIYFILKFFKGRTSAPEGSEEYLRRVATLNLGPNKSVEIVTLLDKGYLIGVTDHNINLLTEVDDAELLQALNLNFDKNRGTKKPMNFSEVLDMFMARNPDRKNDSIYSKVEESLDSNGSNDSTETTESTEV